MWKSRWNNSRWLNQIITALYLLVGLSARICNTTVPKNELTVNEGEHVVMSCHTTLNSPVEWGLTIDKSNRRIYSDGMIQSTFVAAGRYNVSVADGFYNLTIENVRLDDSGNFYCKEDDGFGDPESVRLDVSEVYTDHTNTTVVNGTNASLNCSTAPNGTVQWWSSGRGSTTRVNVYDGQRVADGFASTVLIESNTTAGEFNLLVLNVTSSKSFVCWEGGSKHAHHLIVVDRPVQTTSVSIVDVTQFTSESIRETTPAVVGASPDYTTQPVVKRDTSITVTVAVGSTVILSCYTSGASVTWLYRKNVTGQPLHIHAIPRRKVSGNLTVSRTDHSLILHSVQVNDTGWYECVERDGTKHIAVYLETYRAATMPVSSPTDNTNSEQSWFIVSIVVIIALFGSLTYIVWIRRRKCQTDNCVNIEDLLPSCCTMTLHETDNCVNIEDMLASSCTMTLHETDVDNDGHPRTELPKVLDEPVHVEFRTPSQVSDGDAADSNSPIHCSDRECELIIAAPLLPTASNATLSQCSPTSIHLIDFET